MSEISDELSTALGSLVFQSFVAVADAEDGIGPREVEKFHALISSPATTTSGVARSAMAALCGQYSEYWKNFNAGMVDRSPVMVESAWKNVRGRLSHDDALAFASCTTKLLEEVVKAGSPALARLGLASNSKSKALDEVRRILAPEISKVQRSVETMVAPVESGPACDANTPEAFWPAAGLVIGKSEVWVKGKTKVRCVAVVPETHDVKTFIFVADPGRLFTYKPGQFVTLELPIEGKIVRRSYTISSSPSRPYTISVTVKRVPNGRVSNWLHDNMAIGFEFNLSGPNGDFTCFDAPAEKLLLIAGGSGITPLMSMLRWLSDTGSDTDIVFLDFVRSPDDVIFHQELLEIAAKLGERMKLGIFPGRIGRGQKWNGTTGPISGELLNFMVHDFKQREAFVCGPAPFMDRVKGTLGAFGHPKGRYHQESFGGVPVPAAPVIVDPNFAPDQRTIIFRAADYAPAPSHSSGSNGQAPTPAKSFAPNTPRAAPVPVAAMASASGELVFSKSGRSIQYSSDDVILDLAEANGIALEHSCRAGTCGTCRTKKLEGTVEHDDQQALSADDLSAGYVLACVGRPRGKVVLDA